jgi:hypothetical protein
MIKFERLSNGAKATIIRNEVTQPVYIGMAVSREELATLNVISGTVLYTIDEKEIVEVSAKDAPAPAPKPVQVEKPEVVEATTPVEPVVAVKPAIVKPAPRTAKK